MKISEKLVKFEQEHKIVPKSIAAVTSATAAFATVAVGASAAEGESSVDLTAVTESLTTSLKDLVSKAAVACAAVVGVALTIYGIKWLVNVVRNFFSSVAK